MLRVLIVDDEPLMRRDLVRLLSQEPEIAIVAEARHGLEALELIDQLRPDAVFLDVQMPELDGLGVVAELDPATAPAIVFVTAFDRYALQAFDAHAVDYLLKPFDAERLRRAIERVRGRLAGARVQELERAVTALLARPSASPFLTRLAARGAKQTALLDVADILWIEAADNYVRLHTAQGSHLSRRTMRDLEGVLDPSHFARIHRSTIVNLRHVRAIASQGDGDYDVLLDNGAKVTLARSYRQAFEARFGGIA